MLKSKKRSKAEGAKTVLYPVAFGAVILALWQTQVLHKLFHTDTYILPLPTRIIQIIGENTGKIWENIIASMIVILCGLFFGSLLGYLIALFAASVPKFGSGALTIISAFNAIPIVALAPVIINWTKDVSEEAATRSMVAKIIVVTIVCTAAMSMNAYRGLTDLKPFSLDLMKSYAADNRTIFAKLRFPNSIPYIFTALRVSVPGSVIGALVSEYFAEYRIGVGRQIRENILIAQYATAWAYIVVACLIGIIMFAILLAAESILMRKRK